MSLYARVEMSACPFCHIPTGKRPAHCLYEDERLFVLLDRESLAFGHCLVVPKLHRGKLYELPRELGQPLFELDLNVASSLERVLNVRAVALVAFGSGLSHAHLHLVPHDDPDVLANSRGHIHRMTDAELAEDARKLLEGAIFVGV